MTVHGKRPGRNSGAVRVFASALFVVGLVMSICVASAGAASCFGKKAKIVSSGKKIIGSKRPDTIVVKGGGTHYVNGQGGNDRICGGPGDDTIIGDKGTDRINGGGGGDDINGGKGTDDLRGGGGDDRILGDKGSDKMDGGSGDDHMSGDKSNDKMIGGSGADDVDGGAGDEKIFGGGGGDTLVGGLGTEKIDGGTSDDIIRPDSGSEQVDGGPGGDIVSFSSSPKAITLDLGSSGPQVTGDGYKTLAGIEDVVGSAFADEITGDSGNNRIDGGPGYDDLAGGDGSDTAYGGVDGASCANFEVRYNCGRATTPGSGVQVVVSRGLDGSSLVIKGDNQDSQINILYRGDSYYVNVGGQTDAYTGDPDESGCTSNGALTPTNGPTARCEVGANVNLILATGGRGNDEIRVGDGVPGSVPVRVNGGYGDDTLVGGPGDDVLEAGDEEIPQSEGGPTSGSDHLIGGPGNDALVADPGADVLEGEGGNDLLVSSAAVCQGHNMDGGADMDTVSFARVRAAASGYSGSMKMTLGVAGGPTNCGNLDKFNSLESLEGSGLDDTLTGTSESNSFFARDGKDTVYGKGGRDSIDMRDGIRDARIDCGGGRSTVLADKIDPKPINCR